MHILYLDDSGAGNNPNEDYFVFGGICVPENSVRWLSYQLEQIAEELHPTDPASVEFHASEIFHGKKGIWRRYERNERIDIIKRVLRVLENAHDGLVTMACAVHVSSFAGEDPVLKAYEEISTCFHHYLRQLSPDKQQPNERGIIVLDKSSYEHSLQGLASEFRRSGNRRGNYLTNICEVPLFVDSKASRNIQLADHIAHAVFRRYNASDLSYFNCIEGRFDQDANGVIHGLIHRQTYNHNCTCPACITRR